MKTFISGKDAALEDTISFFQNTLSQLGLTIEEVSWLNPVPNVWSVHIREKSCPQCFTNGKGSTRKAALASALGEYFERLSTNYFFADYYLGAKIANAPFVHYPNEKWFTIPEDDTLPKGILDAELLAFYNADSELTAHDLVDVQSGNAKRGICSLPFIRQSDQQTVFIPVNIIGNLYVSNGMSAGNTPAEARVQCLSEIFERYVKNYIISNAISLPEIPKNVLARYPSVMTSISALEQEGFPIYCYDASLGGQYPVICVVLFNPQNHGCFASFGAHPDFSVALERTVTELLQGRSLNDLDTFPSPSFDYDDVAEHTNLETHFIDSSGVVTWKLFNRHADYPFVDWNFSGTTAEEFANLLALFGDNKVYIANYEHLGVYCCRILVPGISEIYAPEDLYLNNNNMASSLRETLFKLSEPKLSEPKLSQSKLTENKLQANDYQALLTLLDEEGLDDFSRLRELLGIAPAKESIWYTLRVGELKALLALASGDIEQALDWVDWALDFNQSTFSFAQNNFYHCLKSLLQLYGIEGKDAFSDYQPAFEKMYGKDTVKLAWDHINQKSTFYTLDSIDNELTQLPAHQALLAIYQRLQDAKEIYWKKMV